MADQIKPMQIGPNQQPNLRPPTIGDTLMFNVQGVEKENELEETTQ